MTSDQTNPQLPFDVLGLVFSHYADEETVEHRLETLLLVCRAWSDAALGHCTLWTNFRIRMGHGLASWVWMRRLQRRLARSGPNTPLDIDVHTLPEDTDPANDEDQSLSEIEKEIWNQTPCHHRLPNGDCLCADQVSECAHQAIRILGGEDGQHCVRWRSLKLRLSGTDNANVAFALCHPTPNLTLLELVNFRLNSWHTTVVILPCIPLVKEVTLLDCFFPSFPSFENATEATIGWTVSRLRYPDLSSLRKTTTLQKLSLRMTTDCEISLPPQLNELRVLHIEGETIPVNIYKCKMPQLSCLTMDLRGYEHDEYWMDRLFHSDHLPLTSLRRLTLMWDGFFPQGESGECFILPIRNLLIRARNLEYVTSSGNILSIIIRILWWSRQCRSHGTLEPPPESARSLLRDVCLANADSGNKIVISERENARFFVNLAKRWYCVAPDLDEDSFFEPMTVSTRSSALQIALMTSSTLISENTLNS
jgi:hypothetical protein